MVISNSGSGVTSAGEGVAGGGWRDGGDGGDTGPLPDAPAERGNADGTGDKSARADCWPVSRASWEGEGGAPGAVAIARHGVPGVEPVRPAIGSAGDECEPSVFSALSVLSVLLPGSVVDE